MQSNEDIILNAPREQLMLLRTLLRQIQNSEEITLKEFKVYSSYPQGEFKRDVLKPEESSIFTQQAEVLKQILQHPNCPEDLSFNITLTNNYETYATGKNRERTPLAPIFEILASGKCKARGLKIKLEGDEVGHVGRVLKNEMDILVKGLKEGKCPNNLEIEFGTLDLKENIDGQWITQPNYHMGALMDALKSPNCPSGLIIKYQEFKNLGSGDGGQDLQMSQKIQEFNELCTEGTYDRKNITNNIDKIWSAIHTEITLEIRRLGDKDKTRKVALEELSSTLQGICSGAKESVGTCAADKTWELKTHLRNELEKKIKDALATKNFDKKYSSLEKLARNLLNIITGILFPLAIIKYATTGNAFFSTVGKSQEAVEKMLDISKKLK